MIRAEYSQRFLRDLAKLPEALREEAFHKVELFTDPKNHARLRVHKLHGALKGRLSFSVDYRFRIIFQYIGRGKTTAVLITIGDHSMYD